MEALSSTPHTVRHLVILHRHVIIMRRLVIVRLHAGIILQVIGKLGKGGFPQEDQESGTRVAITVMVIGSPGTGIKDVDPVSGRKKGSGYPAAVVIPARVSALIKE